MGQVDQLLQVLPLLNVLIVPALVFVVKIDKRLGQIDVLADMNSRRVDALERELRDLTSQVIHMANGRRHV